MKTLSKRFVGITLVVCVALFAALSSSVFAAPDDDYWLWMSISTESNITRAYYESASNYAEKGDYDKAIECWKKTIDLQPDVVLTPLVYYNIGSAYYKKGDYDEAVGFYSKSIATGVVFPEATYYRRGATYEALERLEEAKLDYAKACELDPKSDVFQEAKRRSENW